MDPLQYLIVVPVEFYKSGGDNWLCEGAFVQHLKDMKKFVLGENTHLHIVGTSMPEHRYQSIKGSLMPISVNSDGIQVTLAHPSNTGRIAYNLNWLVPNYRTLRRIIAGQPTIVHSGPSTNVFRLFEFLSVILAKRFKCPSVFVVDIDESSSARMDYLSGNLSWKSFCLRKYFYDPAFSAQIKYAVRNCNLVMLKSRNLVEKYGGNRKNVKNFLDVAIDKSHVISQQQVDRKLRNMQDGRIRLVYFGRLTRYKGILDMVQVVYKANQERTISVDLTIIGDGEQEAEIREKVFSLSAEKFIHLKKSLKYGDPLFSDLDRYDFLIATPQTQDTPRNVFDAMGRGIGTIAYDTYYYKDLVNTGAVVVSPWRNIDSMVDSIDRLANDIALRQNVVRQSVRFALQNTQDIWLQKRKSWLEQFVFAKVRSGQ